jgi:hypothetical protein
MMNKPFEAFGRWWSPACEYLRTQPFLGRLTWDPVKGATIEAAGLSSEVTNSLSHRLGHRLLLQGQLDNLPCITLDDAMVVSVTTEIIGTGNVKITSNKLTQGDDVLADTDQTLLLSLSCEMTGLDVWAAGNTFTISHPEPARDVIECLPYKEQLFTQVDDITVSVARWNRSSHGIRTYSIEGVNTFTLKAGALFSYERGRQLLHELKAFLTVALDRPIVFETIRGRLEDSDQKMPDGRPVSRHMEFFETTDELVRPASKKDRHNQRIPFLFQPVERAAEAFQRFRDIYRKHRMSLDFFLSQTYGTKSYINQQFADLVHGLEGLHRGLRGGTFMEQAAYDKTVLPALVSGIPAGIDTELRQALKKRLEFGNEFSLRRRLKELARFHEAYAGAYLGKASDFADTIANMRNELAHAIGTNAPNRNTVTQYFIMLHRVRMLFQLELFHQLGFDTDFLKKCAPRLRSAEFASREP